MNDSNMYFIDTNIFVYAHDETDLLKAKRARQLLIELAGSNKGRISTQVIQEFCNVALRKSLTPLKVSDTRKIVRELFTPFLAHQPDAAFYLRVLDMYERYSLSFYDAAIVQAANDLNCTVLYSEDLQTGAQYGKIKVVNPFL
jgi:predicted nucleic acid-binding protein